MLRVFLTLGITGVVEQESLEVAIFGSADRQTWAKQPLFTFPQKFYKGNSAVVVDLSAHGDVGFVQAHWTVHRWGRGGFDATLHVLRFRRSV